MPEIRPLTEADIPAGQRLRAQAGWNQTDADWRRLLAWDRSGCWAAEQDGQVVGTTTVTTYGRRIAWVGMVLVDEAHRRQGIGQALLSGALAYLDQIGVQTVALDSTPAGQPLYARLGFQDAFQLSRWRGPLPPSVDMAGFAGDHAALVRPFGPDDLPAVAGYDAARFGVDRRPILQSLRDDHPAGCLIAERDGRLAGYVLSRPGARAWHLGPLVASDAQTAVRLVRGTLASGPPAGADRPDELVMDVVTPNQHARALAEALGLTMVRPFIRMTRGTPPPEVEHTSLYTSAGPELG